MKKRDLRSIVYLSVICSILIYACTGSPQEEATVTDSDEPAFLHAHEVASEHYTLISEDESVRVIEMYLPAGERDNLHSHPWETVYFISGGHARLFVDGEEREVEIPDGYVLHSEPWTHSVENIGDTDIHAIIVERQEEVVPVEPYEDYIDVLAASPDHYTLLSESGNVRVIRMTLPPGERDELHSHYYETVYFLSGGSVNLHVGDEIM